LSNLENLTQRVRKARRTIDGQIAEAKLIAANGKRLNEEIALAASDKDLHDKVAITLASIGEVQQATAQTTIEELVTRGLRMVFQEDLTFTLMQTQRGKTPEVKFQVSSLINNKPVSTSVMDARGGGLAAVVGYLLRLVVLMLSKKPVVLILDETFAHVSAEYEGRLAEFLKELIDKTNSQVILVTHSQAFSEFADKRYRTKLVNGTTKIEEI
jgi:DNA repair exonuclease SbcCD ATPase subunit